MTSVILFRVGRRPEVDAKTCFSVLRLVLGRVMAVVPIGLSHVR